MTSSASGKRSRVANRPRGSTTNGRQPAARAMRQSAAAKSTAPKTISRGGGATTSTNSVAAQLRALGPHQLLGVRDARAASRSAIPSVPDASPSGAHEQLRAERPSPDHDGDERRPAAGLRDRLELGLQAHGS